MISRLRNVAVSRLRSRTATNTIQATNRRISTIASTLVTSLRIANTTMISGASANTTMYSRGMLNVVGARIAPSASTMPLNDTAVPRTRPSATSWSFSRFSAIPRTMSSNSIPVKMIASRKTETANPRETPTSEMISRSAL